MGAQIWLCVCVRQGPAQALVEIAVKATWCAYRSDYRLNSHPRNLFMTQGAYTGEEKLCFGMDLGTTMCTTSPASPISAI